MTKTETQHTPGPWKVGADGGIVAEDCYRVATVEKSRRLSRDANARLIAAAPGLLVALREAWRDIEDILTSNVEGGHPDIDDQTRRDLRSTADALWAAIARAEVK